jgi:hypothetical protein
LSIGAIRIPQINTKRCLVRGLGKMGAQPINQSSLRDDVCLSSCRREGPNYDVSCIYLIVYGFLRPPFPVPVAGIVTTLTCHCLAGHQALQLGYRLMFHSHRLL